LALSTLRYLLLHPLECINVLNASSSYKYPCSIVGSLGHVLHLSFRTLLCSLCNESVLKPETEQQTSYIIYWNGKLNTSKPNSTWNLTRCHVHNSPQLDLYLEPQAIHYATSHFVLYTHLNIMHPITLSLPSGFLAMFEDPCVMPQACYIPHPSPQQCVPTKNSDTPIASCIIILALL
jgi:hypothetical protein